MKSEIAELRRIRNTIPEEETRLELWSVIQDLEEISELETGEAPDLITTYIVPAISVTLLILLVILTVNFYKG